MTDPIAVPAAHLPQELQQAVAYADHALHLMRTLTVVPNPKHYGVFYAYAGGQPTELVREIEQAIASNRPMSDEFLDMQHINYIAEAQTRAVQDSASAARKILAEIMHNVTQFAGETSAAGADIALQLEKLDAQSGEENLRLLADALMQSAATIHDSSHAMTERLSDAQAEITQLRQNLARVVTEAERDFLTGCYNRKAFDRLLTELIDDANKNETELTLLMLDIDHFKQFNDKYGHLFGDEVLKIVAKTLSDMLKGTDCVARYGGEEFAIILPRTPANGGSVVGEQIRKSIASKELKRRNTGQNLGGITVSIGVTRLRHHEDTLASFIERADMAMYQSKTHGRNRVTQG